MSWRIEKFKRNKDILRTKVGRKEKDTINKKYNLWEMFFILQQGSNYEWNSKMILQKLKIFCPEEIEEKINMNSAQVKRQKGKKNKRRKRNGRRCEQNRRNLWDYEWEIR